MTTSCPPRSRASRPPPIARRATSASWRTRSTTPGHGSWPPSSSRSSPPALLGGLGYWRFGREHPTGTAAEVPARATGRPGARARAVAACATGHRRRRPDGGDALRARPPRPLQDDAGHARGVEPARPAPQGGRRRRPHARRREHRAERRGEAGGRDLRQAHRGRPGGPLARPEDGQGPADRRQAVVPRALAGVRVGRQEPGAPAQVLERPGDGPEVARVRRSSCCSAPAASRSASPASPTRRSCGGT